MDPSRDATAAYLTLWRFQVPEENVLVYEAAYGFDGPWAALFDGTDGYLGTELVRVNATGTYMTINRWRSRSHLERFTRSRQPDYDEIDALFEPLTTSQEFVAAGDATARQRP